MDTEAIFEHLFKVAKKSTDPEGVVASCLVRDGEILVSSPSADDGIRHAEHLVLEIAGEKDIEIDDKVWLITTLEPCSYRDPKNNVKDCTTIILNSGVRNVLFGALDPEFSKDARNRFKKAGVNYKKIKNKEVERKCIELFNSTITIPLTSMNLPRKKKLPK